jgi:two-component system sensor histidine kinase DesK
MKFPLNELPIEIKLTYLVAILVMFLLVGFILTMVWISNKKQLLYKKERQLRESEYQNDLLKAEIARQTAVQKERERISLDMHDELGAGISALKLQVEFLKHRISNEDFKTDVEELLHTAESMNLSMREMLWSLNSNNDKLGNFLPYLVNYAENFLQKTSLQFHSSLSSYNPDYPISSEIRRNLLLCLKEALNNSYKHSGAKNIYLKISQFDKELKIQFQDDGFGITSQHIKGNGLNNMHQRMKNMDGKFQLETTKDGVSLEFVLFLD